jgi:putative flippase GtrA
VNLSPSTLFEHARSDQGRKQLRYAGVSVVFVPLGQVFVLLLKFGAGVPAQWAVLITACILTVPNYFANKLYVWKSSSSDQLHTQILVFWVAAMLGTLFAMGLVLVAERVTADMSDLVQAAAVFAGQLAGYGIVWVARFIFLDRWLFKVTHHGEEPSAEEVSDLHHDLPI